MINKNNLPLENMNRYKLQLNYKLKFKKFEEHVEKERFSSFIFVPSSFIFQN